MLSWEDRGVTWEPDQRHAESIVQQLGLTDGKPACTPGSRDEERAKVIAGSDAGDDTEVMQVLDGSTTTTTTTNIVTHTTTSTIINDTTTTTASVDDIMSADGRARVEEN